MWMFFSFLVMLGALFGYHGKPASYDLVHSIAAHSAPAAHSPVYARPETGSGPAGSAALR